jgi:NADH-quinone oxidoreductase subunit A
MYPWAVMFRELGWFGYVEMMMFVAVLGVGYLFAWRKGALEWK